MGVFVFGDGSGDIVVLLSETRFASKGFEFLPGSPPKGITSL
jgi:hypothetical protein